MHYFSSAKSAAEIKIEFATKFALAAPTVQGGASSMKTVSTRWMTPLVHSMLGLMALPVTSSPLPSIHVMNWSL